MTGNPHIPETHFDALPPDIRKTLQRAVRLEWWNIFWTVTIVVAMGLVMGGSQTMKTAWVEDTLGFVPPAVFLIAAAYEKRGATLRFPFGYDRVNSLAFLIAAVALAAVGVLLLWDSAMTLVRAEHATVGSIVLFGQEIWLGWLMLAAQFYSMIPPFIIGRMELPLAERLNDKVLYTDANMNKANWMTGAAGIAGVLGLGLGYWWADSVAAALISVSIIHDGFTALRSATAELIDGSPRALDSGKLSDEAEQLKRELCDRFLGAEVRLRETGRYISAEVRGVEPADRLKSSELWRGAPERSWRLAQISFVPPDVQPASTVSRGSMSPAEV